VDFIGINESEIGRVSSYENFILFGSVASETNTNDSDIDIAYIENEKSRLNFDNYLKLENELKKIFNAKIDLINYKKIMLNCNLVAQLSCN